MRASHIQAFNDIGADTITLMGGSFVLGSLFTVLLLVILDWRRRRAEG